MGDHSTEPARRLLLSARGTLVRSLVLAIVFALVTAVDAPAAARDQLDRARELYNAGKFDEAIAAAEPVRKDAALGSAASLIVARARLERIRRTSNTTDLAAVRAAFAQVHPRQLSARDQIAWEIGVAEALYLDGQPGPAAELFGAVAARVRATSPPAEVEKLIDWWARSMADAAQPLPATARTAAYRNLLATMDAELERSPSSATVPYWIAAAARGAGDLDRAWNAALAAWIRAGALENGDALRADLERLMVEGVIPERAQQRTKQNIDQATTVSEMAALTSSWRIFTLGWASGK